jgi:hypothetical protein
MGWSGLLLAAVLAVGIVPAAVEDPLIVDLATKIAAAINPTDTVQVAALPTDTPDPDARRRLVSALRDALNARAVHIVEAAGVASVAVACSTNLRERVCAATIRKANGADTIIATGPLAAPTVLRDPSTVLLDLRHVFAQSAPILDVALAGDRLIVLDGSAMSLYERVGAAWQRRRSQPIGSVRAWPRDVRGRLRVSGSSVDAFLPGAVCRASIDAFAGACSDERQPWPIGIDNAGIAAGRNYFTTPEGLPFFASAPVAGDAGARFVVLGDGSRVTLLDEGRRPVAPPIGSAIDLGGLTGCGSGDLVWLAAPGRGGDGDVLRVFRVAERRLIPASSPLVLPGILTALWTEARTATTIVRSFDGDQYEALQIDAVCGR